MKKNIVVLVIAFLIIMLLTGGVLITHFSKEKTSNSGNVRVYVMLLEKNAAFEMADFSIKVGNALLNETNKPVLAYQGSQERSKWRSGGARPETGTASSST